MPPNFQTKGRDALFISEDVDLGSAPLHLIIFSLACLPPLKDQFYQVCRPLSLTPCENSKLQNTLKGISKEITTTDTVASI